MTTAAIHLVSGAATPSVGRIAGRALKAKKDVVFIVSNQAVPAWRSNVKSRKAESSTSDPELERPESPRSAVPRRSTVAKVSHTLSIALAERLEEFAFFQRISESAVIEHCLQRFFRENADDTERGEILRSEGAGRRRKS